MNDGFNWFVAAITVLGFGSGLIIGSFVGTRGAAFIGIGCAILAIIAFFKFMVTPVEELKMIRNENTHAETSQAYNLRFLKWELGKENLKT